MSNQSQLSILVNSRLNPGAVPQPLVTKQPNEPAKPKAKQKTKPKAQATPRNPSQTDSHSAVLCQSEDLGERIYRLLASVNAGCIAEDQKQRIVELANKRWQGQSKREAMSRRAWDIAQSVYNPILKELMIPNPVNRLMLVVAEDNPYVTQIPNNASVLTTEGFIEGIGNGGLYLSNMELTAIMSACEKRLNQRYARKENQTAKENV